MGIVTVLYVLVVDCVKVWFSDICRAVLVVLVQSVADGAVCSPWAVQPGLLACSIFCGVCVG